LLATLDDGLKDPKHFDPDTKTTFWVGVQASSWECDFTAKHYLMLNFICTQVLVLIYIHFVVPNIPVRKKLNVKLKKLN
jgi:hypothetical protein